MKTGTAPLKQVKLALHRSLTFWSGLLVMGFTCWACWWSSGTSTTVSYQAWKVLHWRFGIDVEYVPSFAEAGWSFRSSPRNGDADCLHKDDSGFNDDILFHPPFFISGEGDGLGPRESPYDLFDPGELTYRQINSARVLRWPELVASLHPPLADLPFCRHPMVNAPDLAREAEGD